MKNIDDVLDKVRSNSDWDSDYKIGRGLGYTNSTQVSGWRRRVAMPNIEDIIAMCDHANIDLEAAVRAVAYSRKYERPIKQAGFADLGMMGVVSLTGVTLLPHGALFEAVCRTGTMYIMLNERNMRKAANDSRYGPLYIIAN